MNNCRLVILLAAVAANVAVVGTLTAQEPFAYPPAARTPEQQRQDQFECHQWAVEQSHFDPSAYAAQAPAQTAKPQSNAQPSTGAAVVGGAARGALIAEVADEDSGDGARAGAALGMLRARRAQGAAAVEQQRAGQQAQQQQQQQAAELRSRTAISERGRRAIARGATP
jgi:hypothetical protein